MREVELYRTADEKKKERLLDLLMKERISYLEKQEKIPIFRRKENFCSRDCSYDAGSRYDSMRQQ